MFMCRVIVGDWSRGSNGILTPATKGSVAPQQHPGVAPREGVASLSSCYLAILSNVYWM